MSTEPFTDQQIAQLTKAFHRGASEASTALAQWLHAPMSISIDAVDQCPLESALSVLGEGDNAVCMVLMEMEGLLTGHMLLAFDDVSGLGLSDMLLSRPKGTATSWEELERSCVMETMNIAGSAYLNGIAHYLSEGCDERGELIPSPPQFLRDFAESLLQSAFMEQALFAREVVFAKARFDLSGQPLRWTFLLIPDPASLETLAEILNRLS